MNSHEKRVIKMKPMKVWAVVDEKMPIPIAAVSFNHNGEKIKPFAIFNTLEEVKRMVSLCPKPTYKPKKKQYIEVVIRPVRATRKKVKRGRK